MHTQSSSESKGFHTVFDSFCDWCGNDFVFLVWGTEDLRILRKNMELHNIDISFMPPRFNLQNIFVAQVTSDTKQYALANALTIAGEVPFDSHVALNDARSTALLCTHLDLIRGLKKYKETVENRVVVKRLVYALTDELRTDYQQCVEQAAAWSKYVILAYSF